MTQRKLWTKPSIEVAQIRSAQAGAYSTTDGAHTHRSL